MSGAHLSKDFFALVKAIGESKSKQEEDRIIINGEGNVHNGVAAAVRERREENDEIMK